MVNKDDDITLFAVASLPQGVDEVYLDDSVIVTVTLYANVNFAKIDTLRRFVTSLNLLKKKHIEEHPQQGILANIICQ